MRKIKVRSYANPEFTHSNRELPPQEATTPRPRRTQDSTMDPCTPLAVRFARRYVGIICEENLALESSTASEDSIGIIADGQQQHFMDMSLCQGADGHSGPPRETPEPRLSHASDARDPGHQSANVLGADQSVLRHRGNNAMAHPLNEATTRRQKEGSRQVNLRVTSPVNHAPPRSSPTETIPGRSDDASQDVGGPPIQRWERERNLAEATEMKHVGSIIEGMCHGVHQVLPNLSERIKGTETGSTLHYPPPSAPLRGTGAPITGTRPKIRTSDPTKAVMRQKEVVAIPDGTKEQLERRRDALRAAPVTPMGKEDKNSIWNLDSWLNEWKSLTRTREYNEGIAILFFLELIQGSKVKELKSRVQRELQSTKDLLAMITGLELLQEKEEELRLFLWKNLEREDSPPARKTEAGKKTPEGIANTGIGETTRCTSQSASVPRSSTTSKRQRRPHQLSPSAIYEGLMILMVRTGTEMRGMLREASLEMSLRAAATNPSRTSRGTTHPPEIETLTRGVKGPFSREQRKPIPGPTTSTERSTSRATRRSRSYADTGGETQTTEVMRCHAHSRASQTCKGFGDELPRRGGRGKHRLS